MPAIQVLFGLRARAQFEYSRGVSDKPLRAQINPKESAQFPKPLGIADPI
jgi:hypothetical protein